HHSFVFFSAPFFLKGYLKLTGNRGQRGGKLMRGIGNKAVLGGKTPSDFFQQIVESNPKPAQGVFIIFYMYFAGNIIGSNFIYLLNHPVHRVNQPVRKPNSYQNSQGNTNGDANQKNVFKLVEYPVACCIQSFYHNNFIVIIYRREVCQWLFFSLGEEIHSIGKAS